MNSKVIRLCHWCSSSNLSVYFRHGWYWKWNPMVLMAGHWAAIPTTWLMSLLKVRLCSSHAAGNTSYRCVVRLPPTPSSSTSKRPFMHESLCTYIYIYIIYILCETILLLFMFRILRGNIQVRSIFSSSIAWRH